MTQENRFKVPKKQWGKWSEMERTIFNETYEHMKDNQTTYLHPKAATQYQEYWETTAWNAAWIAADFAREYRKS